MEEPRFFNPYGELRQTENRLPHWQQEGAVYFVTFHLADSLPQVAFSEWEEEERAWLRQHPRPWLRDVEREYHRRFSDRRERWLDAGDGGCALRRPRAAGLVGQALAHFEAERVHQISWVIMPNHVHALFIPRPPWTLEQLMHSWKSYTAHALARIRGCEGGVWQRDYFDRLVRDHEHFANCVRYIRRNPAKGRLRSDEYLLWESEMAQGIE